MGGNELWVGVGWKRGKEDGLFGDGIVWKLISSKRIDERTVNGPERPPIHSLLVFSDSFFLLAFFVAAET